MINKYNLFRVLLFPVFWLIVYVLSTQKSLIFAGDTLSYLNMASSISNFNLPEIDAFMPIYPSLIAIFSKILHIDLIDTPRIVNGTLLILAFFIINYILIIKEKTNLLNQVIFNIPFISNVVFIEHSVKIMPEMLFLFSTLLVLYLQYLFVSDENRRKDPKLTFHLGCAITFALFVKFNGMVHLLTTILIFIIYLNNNRFLLFRNVSIVSILVLIPYSIYIITGAGSEFLVIGASPLKIYKIDDLMFYISCWNNDLFVSFIHFFGTETSRIWLKSNSVQLSFVYTFNLLMCLWIIYAILISFRKANNVRFVIYLFIFIYLFLLFFRGVPVFRSEVNTRTIFYVLVLLELDLFILFGSYLKNILNRNYRIYEILMVTLISLFFVIQTTRFTRKCFEYRNKMEDISDLADSRFNFKKSQLLKRTSKLLRNNNWSFDNVFTNQQKILGIYTRNFKELAKIPSASVFNGNRNTVDTNQFLMMKKETDIKFLKGDALMIVFHGRSVRFISSENEYLKTFESGLVTVEEFDEGYLAYVKKNKN